MTQELWILSITAASVAFFHTVFGPDHYVPFIVMSKAGKWSERKTFWITLLCGIGHVGSSIILGMIGLALGIAVHHLQTVESFRGNIAGWILIAFGLVYLVWGIRQAIRNKPHTHWHSHENEVHSHEHTHHADHVHVHETVSKPNMTPWILFTVFVFGPCEPLIPLFMYPAAKHSMPGVLAVTIVFSIITLCTMLTFVFLSIRGLNLLGLGKLERYTHALAGFTIFICGFAIQFLGL